MLTMMMMRYLLYTMKRNKRMNKTTFSSEAKQMSTA
jgi:hypothetical protein